MIQEDRELLELAAKAAGMPPPWDANDCFTAWVGSPVTGHWWNPLADDGDAFRLGVMLSLHVKVCRRIVLVEQRAVGDDMIETIGQDPLVSTRRAIIRAAAEIGKAMP